MLFYPSQNNPYSFRVMDVLSGKKCNPLRKYPLRIHEFSVGLLDNRLALCGGYDEETEKPVAACYIHDPITDSWRYLTSLTTARRLHDTKNLKDRIWITGGYSDGRPWPLDKLNTSEFILANGTVQQGPEIPALFYNLLVDLLVGRYMIFGLEDVYIYISKNNSIVKGPSLLGKYGAYASTLFHSPRHNNRSVVMVFGKDPTLQVLDYTVPSSVWEECK